VSFPVTNVPGVPIGVVANASSNHVTTFAVPPFTVLSWVVKSNVDVPAPSSHKLYVVLLTTGNGLTVNTTSAVSEHNVVALVTKAYTVVLPVVYDPGVAIDPVVAGSVNHVTTSAVPPFIALSKLVKSKVAWLLPSSHNSSASGFDTGNGLTINVTSAVSEHKVVALVTIAYTVVLPDKYAPGVPIELLVAASSNHVTASAVPPLMVASKLVKSKVAWLLPSSHISKLVGADVGKESTVKFTSIFTVGQLPCCTCTLITSPSLIVVLVATPFNGVHVYDEAPANTELL